jgi:hypothetical protein
VTAHGWSRQSRGVWILALLVVLWIGGIVLLIVRGPDRGAASPEELAARVEVALRDGDLGALDALVATAPAGSPSAADLMDQSRDLRPIAVDLGTDNGRPLLTMSGQPDDGTTVLHRYPAVQEDGRWLLQPTPAPSPSPEKR